MVSLTSTDSKVSERLVRHMVLNSLRFYRNKFFNTYGELVLCYDSKHYWRRKEFTYYKGTRKRDREKSALDWNEIFEVLNHIRDEIREFLPYKVIEVDGAEADDVIASLVKDQARRNIRLQNNMQPPQKVLVLSGDKDFQQLQRYKFVDQFNPVQKKFVECLDPKKYLLEHIIKSFEGDNIEKKTRSRFVPISGRTIERTSSMLMVLEFKRLSFVIFLTTLSILDFIGLLIRSFSLL